jgi:Zn-dependent membrane protease YugP
MFFDPRYMLCVMLPTLIITGLAQMWISNAYRKWSNVPNGRRVTGQQTAMAIFQSGAIQPVRTEVTGGQLSDHYDPGSQVVRLSQGVAMQPSIASMAITAHELGHVQQHQTGSALMALRTALVPGARFGPSVGIILIILGVMINFTGLALIGLILFAGATLFTVVTLPVELDASRRAMNLLKQSGLIASAQDEQGARAVLTAAAFTYVAAVATSILTLLYYAMLVFGGRSRD